MPPRPPMALHLHRRRSDRRTATSSPAAAAGSVTGTGTSRRPIEQVTGIDVSTLPDGTLTFSVTLTDAAGNTGPIATATATLAITTPTNYAITVNDGVINAGEAAATSFTFSGTQLGTTYNYVVTSSGGDGSVTGTGTITAADQQVTGIDVSALARRNLDLQRHVDQREAMLEPPPHPPRRWTRRRPDEYGLPSIRIRSTRLGPRQSVSLLSAPKWGRPTTTPSPAQVAEPR